MKRRVFTDESGLWDDDSGEGPPAKLDRRRHRDPEETDERREAERRLGPRRHGRRPERDDSDD